LSTTWPAREITLRKVDELVPYARNSRTHTAEQIAQVAASMREWGWTIPVLVDEAGTILAGHCRIAAARLLGFSEVPTMTADGWSDAQKQAYVIADNKLALNAGWDADLLRIELGSIATHEFDLTLLGFEEADLSLAMADPHFEPGEMGEQARLDQKALVTCPDCGHQFEPA